MIVRRIPVRPGEHDVDTVIHTLFARLASRDVFEGLCNPPGGDWSGVSILTGDRRKELRWISLPRVSKTLVDGAAGKRPDHVVQIFGISKTPVLLALESKETSGAVEHHIGPRLTAYMKDLLTYPANAERSLGRNAQWQESNVLLRESQLQFASGVAFTVRKDSDISNVRSKSKADLIMGLTFKSNMADCEIHLEPCTGVGESITDFLLNIPENHNGIVVERSETQVQGFPNLFDGAIQDFPDG